MMAYDPSKDKQIKDYGGIQLDEDTALEIGMWQYNGGPKKIRATKVTRSGTNTYREVLIKASMIEWNIILEAVSNGEQDETKATS
jgi:hypothetical protein